MEDFKTSNESSWDPELQYTSCTTLDFHQFYNSSITPTIITFNFKKTEKSISFFIEDKLKTLQKRPLKSNRLAYSGPKMSARLEKPETMDVMVSLTQTEDSDKDDKKQCRNYPYDGFSSYKNCDEFYVYEMFKNRYNGFIPFWVANTTDDVTATGYV